MAAYWQVSAELMLSWRSISKTVGTGQEVNCEMPPGDERTNHREHPWTENTAELHWLFVKNVESTMSPTLQLRMKPEKECIRLC